MAVRDKGFEVVLKDFKDNQIQSLLHYHKKNGGLSRYVKFIYFYEQVLKQDVDEDQINKLAGQFSEIMKECLTDPKLLIMDTVDYIVNNYEKVPMHIVSGSDGEELRYLCEKLEINQYFKSINGSPTPKKQLVHQILENEKPTKSRCLLIGDSINDYEAAEHNGISFIGYNNIELRTRGFSYIEKFE